MDNTLFPKTEIIGEANILEKFSDAEREAFHTHVEHASVYLGLLIDELRAMRNLASKTGVWNAFQLKWWDAHIRGFKDFEVPRLNELLRSLEGINNA